MYDNELMLHKHRGEGEKIRIEDNSRMRSGVVFEKPKPIRDIAPIVEAIGNLAQSGIVLPRNKTEQRQLALNLGYADNTNPVAIYVGSCPDYSHNGDRYDHRTLHSGIPLLTRRHLEHDVPVLQILDEHGVPYRYTVMVADVEATDSIFCNRFTNGSEEDFLTRCASSVRETARALPNFGLKGEARSSSFFGEFGRDRFMEVQTQYQQLLEAKYAEGPLRGRVHGDILDRMELYRKMYGDRLQTMDTFEQQEFLAGRTMRTMAQYLTLGRLIGEAEKYPIIINHPTRNMGVFNERNKYLLPNDGTKPHPTIPILEMQRKVY